MTRIARRYEPWEHDNAHQALDQWRLAWRAQNPDAALPGVAFTIHIGQEAVTLAGDMGKVDLLRLFAAAGYDGQCPGCGLDWTAKPRPAEAVPQSVEGEVAS